MMYARPEEYKKFFKEVLPILKQLDPNSAQIAADPMFREQLTSVMVQTAISLICFYLIVHLLIYVARVYEKAFANSYIKFYAWSAGILMTLTALLNLGNARIGIFIIPGLLFLFNAFGFKYVNQMQEE